MSASARNPLRALDTWWMAPAPARRLGMIRALVGAYALAHLAIRLPHLLSFAHAPARDFDPVGVLGLLSSPLPPFVVQGLVAVTLLGAVAFALGWRHRVTGPLFALALLVTLTYSNSFGMILHTTNLLVVYVLVLAVTPASDAVSLDARAGRGVEDGMTRRPRYGWPVRLLALVCVIAYVVAGVAKLKNSGMDFATGDTLRNHIAYDNLRKIELGSIHSPLGAWLLPYESFFAVLGFVSLALELGAPVALFSRRLGVLWSIGIWGFHLGVLVLMMIFFSFPLSGVAFAPFFRVERLRWPWRGDASDEPPD